MPTDNTIYLCAPVNALVEGIFEQNVPSGRDQATWGFRSRDLQ